MGVDPQSNQRFRSNLRDERSILGPRKTRLRPMLEPLKGCWKSKVSYEILNEFFNCLDATIRLLQLRGLMPSFTNLRPKIECLTDRRFTISHLAQLKFVLPKVIEITKVLVKDRITNNMKSDLRVTMNVDAVENDNKSKYEGGGHMHLRRAFRHQLREISKSQPEPYFQARNFSASESIPNIVCSPDEVDTAASSSGQVSATPMKELNPIENQNGLPMKSASVQTCFSFIERDRPHRKFAHKRSLKFDTPVNKKKVDDEVLDMDNASIDNGFFDTLLELKYPFIFLQLKDEERMAMEEQIPIISHAKRDQQRISGLPMLVDMIHFVFQSFNYSAITKEELVHKLIWNNFEFTDTNEVEEQLTLLLDLVPEWISEEKSESGGDLLLIHINKMSNPDSIRARLEAAN
ncbi:CDT1-like protein a, chloroplastic [Malus domestica]|uniref:CDT1-like protein a, chloroplastic n=1 Tax=Malus domestica TaxID=3750 RepID=UPI003975870A